MDTSDPLSPPRRFRASGNGAGAISRTPPTWPTTLTRILATVESPRIPVAEAYGGVGWRDVANPNDAVIVLIPQNPYLKVGDTLTLYWGDASRPVDTHVLNQDDLLGSVSMR
ncbi:hypothetical protein, partial [Pandoraea horticolens]|uniref:hypothetical protein n=1 Tax=Pandoraea horticolens TaxID=2508298 RepID=UPI001242C485